MQTTDNQGTQDFTTETTSIFDLNHLKNSRLPLDVGLFMFERFTDKRVNHYCIKSTNSIQYKYGAIETPELKKFIAYTDTQAAALGIDTKKRYCFVTIDQGWVERGTTLRDSGWHLDGMQGDEVPEKKPADLQFIWSDCLPTTFSSQAFDVAGLNPSQHNVFTWISNRIKPETIIATQPLHIYAMNPYHAHKATEAPERIYRRFIRVSYTFTPVTSIRMTVNEDMNYNYEYHKTDGTIPSYLK